MVPALDAVFLNTGGSVSGMVDGDTDGGTLSYANRSSTVMATLTNAGDNTGFTGTATDTGGFDDMISLTAGSATDDRFTGLGNVGTNKMLDEAANPITYAADVGGNTRMTDVINFEFLSNPGGTLAGPDSPTVWYIHGNEVSYVDDMGELKTFFDLSAVQGGNMVDTFNVDGDTTLEIDLFGGGGADIYNIGYVLYGDIMGQDDLDVIIMSYTHDATNRASLARNTTNDALPLDTVSFGRVGGMLIGVMTGGIVDGGADGATLSYAGYTGTDDPVSVALTGMGGTVGFTGTATGISGTFDDILTVTGGSGTTDTLTGIDAAAEFTVAMAGNTYVSTRTLAFSADLEHLIGGSAVDTFTISFAHTGNLSGGGGADVFNIDAALNGMVMGGIGNDAVTISEFGVTSGINTGDDDDTVTINGGHDLTLGGSCWVTETTQSH